MDKSRYEKSGYRFVGNHSAVKVCLWTKKSLRNKGYCYKQKFYGISTHRCLQMTPAFPFCTQRCRFCWRNTKNTIPEWKGPVDEPADILDGCIEKQRELLSGFLENKTEKVMEALEPNQVAISLAGEPTMYPKISELVEEVLNRKMTAFLVSNGTFPGVIKDLVEPTNLYITLAAPNKKVYQQTCQPLLKDGWERLQQSLSLLKNFDCNTVVRLTLVKDLNMVKPEEYAEILEKAAPDFVEPKAFMSVGFSRERLPYSRMPRHKEIREFAERIADASSYEVADEKRESRVVLLKR